MSTDFPTCAPPSQFWQLTPEGRLLPLASVNQDDCDMVLEIPGSFSGSCLHLSESMRFQRAAFFSAIPDFLAKVEHTSEEVSWLDWLFWIDSLHQGASKGFADFPLQVFRRFLAQRPPEEILHFFIERVVSAYYAAWTGREREQFFVLLEEFFPEGKFLFVQSCELIQQIFEASPLLLVDYFFDLTGGDPKLQVELKNKLLYIMEYSQNDSKKREFVKSLENYPRIEVILRKDSKFNKNFHFILLKNAVILLFRLHMALPQRFPISRLAQECLWQFFHQFVNLKMEKTDFAKMKTMAIDMVQQFCKEGAAYQEVANRMLIQLLILDGELIQDLASSFWELRPEDVCPSSEEVFRAVGQDQEEDSERRVIIQRAHPLSGVSKFTFSISKKFNKEVDRLQKACHDETAMLSDDLQESFLFIHFSFRGAKIHGSYFPSDLEDILHYASQWEGILDFLLERLIKYYYHHWSDEKKWLFFAYLSRLSCSLNFLASISLLARICEVSYQPLLSSALALLEKSSEKDPKYFIENILRWLLLATKDRQRAFLKDLSELPDLQALISRDPDFASFIRWAREEREFISALMAYDPAIPFAAGDWIAQMPYQDLSQRVEFVTFLVSNKISELAEVLLTALFCQGASLTILEHPLLMLQEEGPEISANHEQKKKKHRKKTKVKGMPEVQSSPKDMISEVIEFISQKRGQFKTRLEKFLSLHESAYLEYLHSHSEVVQRLQSIGSGLLGGMQDGADQSPRPLLQNFLKSLKKILTSGQDFSAASGSGVREAGLFSSSPGRQFVIQNPLIAQVFSALRDGESDKETLLVGGVLRNLVQNPEAQVFRDIDMVTGLSEEALRERLTTLKTQLESEHPGGSLEFQVSKRIVSLMTMKWFPSRETSSQSIHFDISFHRNLQNLHMDACARDYTMNAMYGRYQEGAAIGSAMIQLLTLLENSDCHAQDKLLVSAGGDLQKTLEEDPSRVLRTIGFLASGYRFASAEDEVIFRQVALSCFLKQEPEAGIFQLKQLFLNRALERTEIWKQLDLWGLCASRDAGLIQNADFSRLSPATIQHTVTLLWGKIQEAGTVCQQGNGIFKLGTI